MLKANAFVGQQVAFNLATGLGHDAGFFKKTLEGGSAALGQGIGIGTNQHTAEKLQLGIGTVIELSDSAFHLHNIDFIFCNRVFDLHFQLLQGGVTDVAGNVMTGADGIYTITFTGIAAGTYEFKVAANGEWAYNWATGLPMESGVVGTAWFNAMGNSSVVVAENDSTVTITFDMSAMDLVTGDGATLCATIEAPAVQPSVVPTIGLKYPALTFEDVITMNVFFTAENLQDVVEMGLITYKSAVTEWSVENAEAVVPGYIWDAGAGFYCASTEGIAAKDMGDTYWFAVYAKLKDGTYTYTRLVSYSPTTYAYNQLSDPAMSKLVIAMLNYGAAAQVYFNYKTDSLMNARLTEEQNASIESYRADMLDSISTVTAEKAANFTRTATGFASRYPTISFEGAFSIDYFCKPSFAPVGDITLYYWNQTDFDACDVLSIDNATGALTLVNDNGTYATAVEGIAAKDLDKGIYVAFVYTDGTNTYCSGILGYSIGMYCQGLAGGSDAMAPFAAATAVYGYYAKQMFN